MQHLQTGRPGDGAEDQEQCREAAISLSIRHRLKFKASVFHAGSRKCKLIANSARIYWAFIMGGATTYQTGTVIAGGGLAGIVTAYELLGHGRRVLLIDKDRRENFGGLARESFGGVHMIGTPHQRRLGIHDSPELAWRDWQSVADYAPEDYWPRTWGQFYCENSREYIFEFLDHKKIGFLPVVNWPERGVYAPGNSVPRWHIVWGTGYEIIQRLLAALEAHPQRANLELLFNAEVNAIEMTGGRAAGIRGRQMDDGSEICVNAEHVVIASGGVCGGDLSFVRAHWHKPWGDPPQKLLNGAHRFGDGMLHCKVVGTGRRGDASGLALALCRGRASSRQAPAGRRLEPGAAALGLMAECTRRAHHASRPDAGVCRHATSGVERPGATRPVLLASDELEDRDQRAGRLRRRLYDGLPVETAGAGDQRSSSKMCRSSPNSRPRDRDVVARPQRLAGQRVERHQPVAGQQRDVAGLDGAALARRS